MKRPPRKNAFSYLIPFFLLGGILASLIYVISSMGGINFTTGGSILLKVETPEVQVLLKNNDVWRDVPENVNVKLVEGDALKTSHQGEATIQLFNESSMYIDSSSTLKIGELSESENWQKTNLSLMSGRALFSVNRILNPKSEFLINMEPMRIHTRGAQFVLSNDMIQVLKGTVNIDKVYKDKVIESTNVGVGQQLLLSEGNEGNFAEIEALPSETYASPWIEKALGEKIEPETAQSNLVVSETEETEEENTTETTEEATTSTPQIASLKQVIIGDAKETESGLFEITGTVSDGAVAVSVNGYNLSKFKKGDSEFLYRAKEEWGNLKEGENEYEVIVTYEDESTLTDSFTINYEKASEETEETPTTETSPGSLTLEVISPEEGAKISADPVTVRGTAPAETAKVTIGDYELRTFTKGDSQWKYNASQKYGNLTPGEENKYLITAYDEDDNEISSIRFSFFSTAEVTEE